ncbi:SsgA family sporulation/cell division regulator [Kitasatospora sp. NPDC048540]|uniref:SsgA family sporulation/cell division regulator n=1 Tax=unclassified Kitasatospora TaxID=2633591 RepID=UPI00053B3B4D|nr:SsgA family sporulation/cell division regulator [Kitasatospora sp. MBT63]
MSSTTVQDHTVMHLVASDRLSLRILVDLEYDAADPYAVRLTFHLPGDRPVSWVFGRDLLVEGIRRPAGEGDVHVHPAGSGPAEVRLVLHAPGHDAVLRAPAAPLIAFLARTDRLVPVGAEVVAGDLDEQLAGILSAPGRQDTG